MHVRTPCVGTLGGLQTAPDVVVGPRREWRKPKPMTNGLKKSDEAVRPVRAANKGARASAESPEERASTKGNPERQSTRRTQRRASVTQAVDRIRQAAERNPKERLTALFHHITPEVLHRAYFALKRNVAAGIDGVTWDMYGEGLEERLLDLHRRLHSGGAYRAPPVRRVEMQAATPVDARAAPAVPASPFQLEALGAHDRYPVVARIHPSPMAEPAVRRQAPEVGAGWSNDHVRICAGGVQQCAFLP